MPRVRNTKGQAVQQPLKDGAFVAPGNSTQYFVMTYMGKESKKEWLYVYV